MKFRIAVLLMFYCSAALSQSALTAADVMARIKNQGASAVLRSIYDNNAQWFELLEAIAIGDEQWLIVAVQLRAVADAGSNSQLVLAVGEALEHRPSNVLSLAIEPFGVADVCGGPDVDDKRFNSYASAMAAIEKRQGMVRSVKNERLEAVRDICLATLEHAKVGIESFYAK